MRTTETEVGPGINTTTVIGTEAVVETDKIVSHMVMAIDEPAIRHKGTIGS